MAILTQFENQKESKKIITYTDINVFLASKGILLEQWEAKQVLSDMASQEEVLEAYNHVLQPYMEENGYKVADVINIHPEIENYEAIRAKFLAEHTHTEDEVRFFVDGQGLFWFHLDSGEVFNVLCEAGDLVSVPKNTRHWFDAGEDKPHVKAIRIFIDEAGWVPHYSGSKINESYPQSL